MHEIELTGLDGSNLLAFMAALGTLRTLTLAEPDARVRMRWVEREWWTPILHHSRIGSGDELVAALANKLCGESTVNAAWKIGEDLVLARAEFARHLREAAEAATPEDRRAADFLAAFGSEAFGDRNNEDRIADTEFRTMSGASNQHFLGFMKELAAATEPEQVARTLLGPWDYGDGSPAMRWDPADYRTHALRVEDPSKQRLDPIRTMRGANRLAVEALPLFPTVPQGGRLATAAFQKRDGEVWVAWPVWTEPLTLLTVGSLLGSAGVQTPDPKLLALQGVCQVFSARRFTKGKNRSFSPAKALI